MKIFRSLLCFFGWHDYKREQEIFCTSEGGEIKSETVVAWDCCRHCCHTKLIHILK